MTSPLPGNTSQTARLMIAAPGYAVGWQEPVYVPAPAAGADWSHKVGGRWYERLIAAQFTLTADAVAANRFSHLVLADSDGAVITQVQASGAVVAGSALTVSLMLGIGTLAVGTSGHSYGVIPDLLIPPDWSWGTVTTGLDPGDTYTGITLLVQRFPSDSVAITAGE